MKIKLLIAFLLLSLFSYSQVGINTDEPKADLDINGSMLIQESLEINPSLPLVLPSDENFKLITRLKNSTPVGEISVLDVDNLTVAPINIVNYEFNNLSSDNLSDVDLQYDTSKYIVGISNFQYYGDAVRKQTSTSTNSIGTFVMRTFESNGTWHLEIQNRFLDILSGSVSYKVTLIVYDKSYFKNLPVIFTDLGGSNSGSASSVPNLN